MQLWYTRSTLSAVLQPQQLKQIITTHSQIQTYLKPHSLTYSQLRRTYSQFGPHVGQASHQGELITGHHIESLLLEELISEHALLCRHHHRSAEIPGRRVLSSRRRRADSLGERPVDGQRFLLPQRGPEGSYDASSDGGEHGGEPEDAVAAAGHGTSSGTSRLPVRL